MRTLFARWPWAVLLLVAAEGLTATARQAQTRDAARPALKGTASLAGTVVTDDGTHAPVRHATVTLSRPGTQDTRATATDDRGRFVFADLPAATYTLSATKGAYLTANYGAARLGAPAVPIPLADGQAFVARPIALTHGSVLTGTVRDPNGQPIANGRVQFSAFTIVNGERQAQFGASTLTDSRGIYRAFGLSPGDYLVSAIATFNQAPVTALTLAQQQWIEKPGRAAASPPPPPGRPFVSAPSYHPGTANITDAVVVTLGRGEERQGVDITMVRVGTARVSGIVYGPDGQPVAGAFVVRSQKHPSAASVVTFTGQSRSAADGTFVMTGVTPGDYTVLARAAATPGTVPLNGNGLNLPAGALTLWAQTDVGVSGDDIDGIELRMQPGMTISGTVVFEGTAPPPTDVAAYRPTLTPVDRTTPSITVTNGAPSETPAVTDRTFKLDGVTPGAYRLTSTKGGPVTSGQSPVWTVKSVMRGATDVLNVPFDVHPREDIADVVVTYTDRHTELAGRFIDSAGQPASEYRVLVFSSNRAMWSSPALPRWMASSRAGVDGSFRVMGLPPGEYYVCALTEAATQVPTFDAAFFDSLVPASIKVTLAEGATVTQTFKVGG